MIKIKAILFVMLLATAANAKKINRIIKKKEVGRIETALSHDSMEGRKTFTVGIEKAAAFISNEMKNAGLQPFGNGDGYLHSFQMISPEITSATITINGGTELPQKSLVCISPSTSFTLNESSNYKVVQVKAGDNYSTIIRPALNSRENTLVLVDTSFTNRFNGLRRFSTIFTPQPFNIVFLLTPDVNAKQYNVSVQQKIKEQTASNVVGLLPGKSKPDEYVIFSGHYDHLGYSKADSTGDSLYNGANDDASGVTAMLMAAKYFAKKNNNERSILFTAFTAEELGGQGSKSFSEKLDPAKIVAMFNIEMIGTDSKWGDNSAYITGYDKSDMGKILEKNLEGSKFKFYPDPYTAQQLFLRSDNATLAKLGVPAHTVSTSKMDNEPHYHKASDEVGTLNIDNMTEIIKAIVISAESIVSGKDTPSRIDQSTNR